MKEFLTSFPSSIRSNAERVMSIQIDRRWTLPNYFFSLVILVCTVLVLGTSAVVAQSNSTVANGEIPVAKDYVGMKWKTTPDLISTFAIEHNQNQIILASSGLQATDVAIYTAYDHLLIYIQADLPGGIPLQEIAVANFQKVVDEAPADATLKYLHVGSLRNLFNQLIEKMALPNTPIPINH
jgi:hypothetical protein